MRWFASVQILFTGRIVGIRSVCRTFQKSQYDKRNLSMIKTIVFFELTEIFVPQKLADAGNHQIH
jgi:hypothetical protein